MVPIELTTAVLGGVVGAAATMGSAVVGRRLSDRRNARASALLVASEMRRNYGQLRAYVDLGEFDDHGPTYQVEVDAIRERLTCKIWETNAPVLARGMSTESFSRVADAHDALGFLHECQEHPLWCQIDRLMPTVEEALRRLHARAGLEPFVVPRVA